MVKIILNKRQKRYLDNMILKNGGTLNKSYEIHHFVFDTPENYKFGEVYGIEIFDVGGKKYVYTKLKDAWCNYCGFNRFPELAPIHHYRYYKGVAYRKAGW